MKMITFFFYLNLVLNEYATISAVLYANTNHPELKVDYPNWNERCKQILKKWRALSPDKRTPYLQKAKENRSYLKKAQQVSKFTHVTLAIKIHWTQVGMHEMNDEKIQRLPSIAYASTNSFYAFQPEIFSSNRF